jgi:histone H3-like centromeric protein A
MSQAQRARPSLGNDSTPGSARKRGRPSGKSVPAGMGAKKRASIGGKRASTGSRIEREHASICNRKRHATRVDDDELALMLCLDSWRSVTPP